MHRINAIEMAKTNHSLLMALVLLFISTSVRVVFLRIVRAFWWNIGWREQSKYSTISSMRSDPGNQTRRESEEFLYILGFQISGVRG